MFKFIVLIHMLRKKRKLSKPEVITDSGLETSVRLRAWQVEVLDHPTVPYPR